MRADGKKLKGTNPMYTVAAHFMDKRYDAMNMITIDIPIQPINDYLNYKRKTDTPTNHLAIIIAAYVRLISQFPELNRFIVNKKFYARNEITVSMVVLKKGSQDHGAMNKMYFEPDDTLEIVTKKIDEYVNTTSAPEDEVNSTDHVINILLKVPGLLRFGVPVLKWCDKHGFLPKSVLDMSPFHASMLITNLASIRTNHLYHHVYNFGNTGLSLAVGNQRYKTVVKNNEPQYIKTLPVGVVMDERVASGGYFAIAFRQFQKYCENPSMLETPPEKIIKDPNLANVKSYLEKN